MNVNNPKTNIEEQGIKNIKQLNIMQLKIIMKKCYTLFVMWIIFDCFLYT